MFCHFRREMVNAGSMQMLPTDKYLIFVERNWLTGCGNDVLLTICIFMSKEL